MNLAAIIIQLLSLCGEVSKPGHQNYTCRQFMIKCATDHYNKQQTESTIDFCTKEYLK